MGTGIAPCGRESRRRKIIPLVAGGLEVMSENRDSEGTSPQVKAIIPESCRLFSAALESVVMGGFAPKPCYSTSDYSSKAFPQVGSAAVQYQQLLRARAGTAAVPALVPWWYRGFGPFPSMGNNKNPRSKPGLVLQTALFFIIEWE
jgi:hypothetical protein